MRETPRSASDAAAERRRKSRSGDRTARGAGGIPRSRNNACRHVPSRSPPPRTAPHRIHRSWRAIPRSRSGTEARGTRTRGSAPREPWMRPAARARRGSRLWSSCRATDSTPRPSLRSRISCGHIRTRSVPREECPRARKSSGRPAPGPCRCTRWKRTRALPRFPPRAGAPRCRPHWSVAAAPWPAGQIRSEPPRARPRRSLLRFRVETLAARGPPERFPRRLWGARRSRFGAREAAAERRTRPGQAGWPVPRCRLRRQPGFAEDGRVSACQSGAVGTPRRRPARYSTTSRAEVPA